MVKSNPLKEQLNRAGNSMILEEEVNFTFARELKWTQFAINAANMNNAGNYTFKLIIEGAGGLAVSGIDIQK